MERPFTILFYYKLLSEDVIFGEEDPALWSNTPLRGGFLAIRTMNTRGIAVHTKSYVRGERFRIRYDTSEPQLDRWLFVGIEREGNEWQLYWNGYRVKTATDDRSDKTVCFAYRIGLGFGWAEIGVVSRIIDEVRIYNKALGPDTIKNLYYRLHLLISNPNSVEINLDNALVRIGNECIIDLEYNTNYITDSGKTVLPPNSSDLIRISTIQCSLTRGTKEVCFLYGGATSCSFVEVV